MKPERAASDASMTASAAKELNQSEGEKDVPPSAGSSGWGGVPGSFGGGAPARSTAEELPEPTPRSGSVRIDSEIPSTLMVSASDVAPRAVAPECAGLATTPRAMTCSLGSRPAEKRAGGASEEWIAAAGAAPPVCA